jgi:hypothetical protein
MNQRPEFLDYASPTKQCICTSCGLLYSALSNVSNSCRYLYLYGSSRLTPYSTPPITEYAFCAFLRIIIRMRASLFLLLDTHGLMVRYGRYSPKPPKPRGLAAAAFYNSLLHGFRNLSVINVCCVSLVYSILYFTL